MGDERRTRAEVESDFRRLARSMCFTRQTIDAFCEGSPKGSLSVVCALIEAEMATRAETKRARLLRQARFPQVKSLDGYDFSGVRFPDGYTADDLRGLGFIDRSQDFVFYGGCGRGKTHLAIAVGLLATQRGYAVRYFETAPLVLALKEASSEGRLERLLRDIAKADLLILDEFGYIPIDVGGARLLYQVMSQTYEARSMIVTTNIEFSKWGTVLADEKLAGSTIDRIVHHGRLAGFEGESRRLGESLMMGKSKE